MTWATLLMSLIGPMALRVLTTIGLGTITFTGVTIALQQLIDFAVTNYGGMSSDILALSGIAGVPQGLGIVVGAMTARVGMWVAVSATRFVFGAA